MKKLVALVLAAAMTLSMVACGGDKPAETTAAQGGEQTTVAAQENVSVETPEASSKDTLIIANTSGEPGNLHPYNTVSIGAVIPQVMLFDALVFVDTKGEIQPALAESWEVTPEGITFVLREGVKFTNGDPVTVDDVVFSIQEMCLNSTGGKASQYTACDVENIEIVDDKTIFVPMIEDNSSQLGYFQEIFIINKKAYEEMGDQYQYEPIGTGAFKLTDWVVGDTMTFEANEEYWAGAPLLKKVVIRTISEVSQALIEVETGGADIMIGPDGSDVQRVVNGEIKGVKAITESTLVLRNNNIQFNHNSPLMGNKLLRQAVAHCIDREGWVNIIAPGIGVPAYCNMASGIWGWDPDMAEKYPYKYDLEAAKKCMEEAGYADGFKLVIYTDNRAYHQALVELLQASLSQVNIELEIQTMELNKQKELMSTGEGFDLFLLDNVGNAADPLSCLWRDSNPMFAGEGGANYHFYTIDKPGAQDYVDKLVAIRSCYDDAERMELCKEMQMIFAENLVWLPVNSNQAYVLANEAVQNVTFFRDILKITNETFFE